MRVPQDEDFNDLVAERYQRGATVTSNLEFSEWGDAFPNRLLGAATCSGADAGITLAPDFRRPFTPASV